MVYKNIKETYKALECTCAAYLGQVVNPGRIVGFGRVHVSNPSPRHDSLFLHGCDRNIVEICGNVNTVPTQHPPAQSYTWATLYFIILQYSVESFATRVDIVYVNNVFVANHLTGSKWVFS